MTVKVRTAVGKRASGKVLPVDYNVMACDGPDCEDEALHATVHEEEWVMLTSYRMTTQAEVDAGEAYMVGEHRMKEEHFCSMDCLAAALKAKKK